MPLQALAAPPPVAPTAAATAATAAAPAAPAAATAAAVPTAPVRVVSGPLDEGKLYLLRWGELLKLCLAQVVVFTVLLVAVTDDRAHAALIALHAPVHGRAIQRARTRPVPPTGAAATPSTATPAAASAAAWRIDESELHLLRWGEFLKLCLAQVVVFTVLLVAVTDDRAHTALIALHAPVHWSTAVL